MRNLLGASTGRNMGAIDGGRPGLTKFGFLTQPCSLMDSRCTRQVPQTQQISYGSCCTLSEVESGSSRISPTRSWDMVKYSDRPGREFKSGRDDIDSGSSDRSGEAGCSSRPHLTMILPHIPSQDSGDSMMLGVGRGGTRGIVRDLLREDGRGPPRNVISLSSRAPSGSGLDDDIEVGRVGDVEEKASGYETLMPGSRGKSIAKLGRKECRGMRMWT